MPDTDDDKKKTREFAAKVVEATKASPPKLSGQGYDEPAAQTEHERPVNPRQAAHEAEDQAVREKVYAPFTWGERQGQKIGAAANKYVHDNMEDHGEYFKDRGRQAIESYAEFVDPKGMAAQRRPDMELSVNKAIENAKKSEIHQHFHITTQDPQYAARDAAEAAGKAVASQGQEPHQEPVHYSAAQQAQDEDLKNVAGSGMQQKNLYGKGPTVYYNGPSPERKAAQSVRFKGEAPEGETPEQRTARKLAEAKRLTKK